MSEVRAETRYEVFAMTPLEVQHFAPLMIEGMQEALSEPGDRQPSDILRRAAEGGIIVWGVLRQDGELVGHATALPKGRELWVLTLAGKHGKDWIHLIHEQIQYLLDEGMYDRVITGARPGMEKWLKEMGWRTFRAIMELR